MADGVSEDATDAENGKRSECFEISVFGLYREPVKVQIKSSNAKMGEAERLESVYKHF